MDEAKQSNARARALILSKALKRRDDVRIRTIVEDFVGELDYLGQGLEELAISSEAWTRVLGLDVEPKMVLPTRIYSNDTWCGDACHASRIE